MAIRLPGRDRRTATRGWCSPGNAHRWFEAYGLFRLDVNTLAGAEEGGSDVRRLKSTSGGRRRSHPL